MPTPEPQVKPGSRVFDHYRHLGGLTAGEARQLAAALLLQAAACDAFPPQA